MSRLIDADALIKVLNKNSIFQKVTNVEGKNTIEIINEQPTIEAVPMVEAEWIKNSPNIGIMEKFHRMGIGKEMSVNSIYWTCSHCGNWGTPNHKFCSNCGADMRNLKES